jgi:hypothetical protein
VPSFTIIPVDQSRSPTEIAALDGGAVLNVVSQIGCEEADVLQDGDYAFSVRLSPSGVWSIFQRDSDADFGSLG